MNAIADLATALKDRKGIITAKTRNAAPTQPLRHAPPPDLDVAEDTGVAEADLPRRRNGGLRYSPGRLHARRLEIQLREAHLRAERAQSALANLQASIAAMPWKTIKEMDREVKRLTAALKKPVPMLRLNAAWKRIEVLEAEAKQLRADVETRDCEVDRLNIALVRASAVRQLNAAWKRIEALEADAATLRAECVAATEQAAATETEQAGLRAQIKDRDHELRKLRDAARERPIPLRRLAEAWQRVETLEKENQELRKKLQGETA